MHGEVQPLLDNPIICAVEIPAASLGNSTGDTCFVLLWLLRMLQTVSTSAVT